MLIVLARNVISAAISVTVFPEAIRDMTSYSPSESVWCGVPLPLCGGPLRCEPGSAEERDRYQVDERKEREVVHPDAAEKGDCGNH